MYPSFFKKPTQKLLILNIINNSKIPLEVLSIIKDYVFYNIETIAFLKKISTKKKELPIIKTAFTRNNLPDWISDLSGVQLTENSSKWMFWSIVPNKWSRRLKIMGENCRKCGEYSYISYTSIPYVLSKINICLCKNFEQNEQEQYEQEQIMQAFS